MALVAVAAGLVAVVPREDGKMKQLSATFLTAEEQQQVTEAVQAAEQQTSGEIVPMVVSASHYYPMSSALGGAFLALPLALLLTHLSGSLLWLGSQNMWLFFIWFSLLYYPLNRLVAFSTFLKRLFLLDNQVAEEVEEAAITSFYAEGLYRTRQENGILLFISLLERKVWVLGDRGINEKISQDQWQEVIEELSKGIREGRQCEALCHAVSKVGTVLRQHFPIGDDDHDELHNIIIR